MRNNNLKIGVLGIQGSIIEHLQSLEKLKNLSKSEFSQDFQIVKVKNFKEIKNLDGLIIPGGESTTIGKLLWRFGIAEEIKKNYQSGKLALWGTCAGAILLAKEIETKTPVENLGLMDIKISRNAYGNQLDSFESEIEFKFSAANNKNLKLFKVPAVFIRAPKILEVSENVEVLSQHSGEIVAAKQGKLLATTFHPEMTENLEIHKFFLKVCGSEN